MIVDQPSAECDVLVIGAGISGLVTAFELRRRSEQLDIQVIDVADYVGGKLRCGTVADVRVDVGAEAIIARRPEGLALIDAVGLTETLCYAGTTASTVALGAHHVPLPADTLMGVPTSVESVAASRALSPAGLARLAQHRPGEPLRTDASVADVIGAALGEEVVDRLVEPLLGGVYAGRADELSIASTIPALYEQLRRTGDILAAARAVKTAQPPSDAPVFATVAGGVGSLPQRLLDVSGVAVALRCPARSLSGAGGGFHVEIGAAPERRRVRAGAVVVATQPSKAARLLAEACPAAAAELESVRTSSTAVVVLAYRRGDLAGPVPAGSGFLVPVSVGTQVKAATYLTNKWPHLTDDEDLFLVRASIGRIGEADALRHDDADLIRIARRDLAVLAGISGEPVDVAVQRWAAGLPQYDVGHRDRVDRIRTAVAQVPGLAVAGATYDGVGIPGCINSAHAAADVVAEHLSGGQPRAPHLPRQPASRGDDR